MNKIENDYIKLWIEDGLLFSALKKPIDVGLEDTKRIIEMRHSLSNNQSQYWVMDMRNLRSVSKEAQSYIETYGQDLIHATAVVVNSFLTKFLVEVFMAVKKPKVPMKIFKSEENARKWLTEMKQLKS